MTRKSDFSKKTITFPNKSILGFVLFEMGFHYVAQIGLELEILLLSLLSAGTTGVHHGGWQSVFYSCFSCVVYMGGRMCTFTWRPEINLGVILKY